MQHRPPHFHFSNICLFFCNLIFLGRKTFVVLLALKIVFWKGKKVKLLLPSPISTFRKEISTPLSSTELKWCQNISKSGHSPFATSFYSKTLTCFRTWTLDFFVIFSKINLFRGAYQMGRGQTFSSCRQDHCWQNKDELVFEILSQEKSRWLLMIFRRRGTRQGFLLETKWDQIIERFKTRFQFQYLNEVGPNNSINIH